MFVKSRLHFLVLLFPLFPFAQKSCAGANAISSSQPNSPKNDAAAAPVLAVYRKGISGLKKGLYDRYATWLNRTDLWAEDVEPVESWESIEGQFSQLLPWSQWVQAKAGRRLILSVGLLPGGWDRMGPKTGKEAGIAVSLEDGANGTYNEHFRKLAENLVNAKLDNSILRLGWEFNTGADNHRALHKEESFVKFWQQVITTMRAVPGATSLQFCWNPADNIAQTDARRCWPGEEYVDYIGIDVYDQSKQHNRPLAIPECGVCDRQDGHGGMDNPYFIEQMHKFIADPSNRVAFHSYFEADTSEGRHQLVPDMRSAFPGAAKRFKELFAAP